jgi:hypothetical protein
VGAVGEDPAQLLDEVVVVDGGLAGGPAPHLGGDDVQPALRDAALVADPDLQLLALGPAPAQLLHGEGGHVLDGGGVEQAFEPVPVHVDEGSEGDPSGRGMGPVRPGGAYRCTAWPRTADRGTGPKVRLSVLADGSSPSTTRRPSAITDATRLTSRRPSRGSATATTVPGR